MTNFIDEHGLERSCCPDPNMQRERWKDLSYGSHYTVTVYIMFCENCGYVEQVWGDK